MPKHTYNAAGRKHALPSTSNSRREVLPAPKSEFLKQVYIREDNLRFHANFLRRRAHKAGVSVTDLYRQHLQSRGGIAGPQTERKPQGDIAPGHFLAGRGGGVVSKFKLPNTARSTKGDTDRSSASYAAYLGMNEQREMLQRQLEGLSGNLTKQKNLSNTQDLLHRVQNSKYEVGVYDEHVTGKVGSTLSFPGAHDTPLPGSETRHAPRGGPKATIKDVPLKVLPDDAKYNKALQLQCLCARCGHTLSDHLSRTARAASKALVANNAALQAAANHLASDGDASGAAGASARGPSSGGGAGSGSGRGTSRRPAGNDDAEGVGIWSGSGSRTNRSAMQSARGRVLTARSEALQSARGTARRPQPTARGGLPALKEDQASDAGNVFGTARSFAVPPRTARGTYIAEVCDSFVPGSLGPVPEPPASQAHIKRVFAKAYESQHCSTFPVFERHPERARATKPRERHFRKK